MKGRLKDVIVLLLIATLLVVPVLAWDVPSEPHAADAMWIEPSSLSFETATTSIGDTFNITVFLNASNPVASWQFQINFDSTWLEVISCVYSGTGGTTSQLFEKSGTTTIPVSPTIGPGYVLFAESWMLGPYGPTNDASSLAYVTFNITAIPNKGETLTSDLSFVYDETYYQDETQAKYKGIGIDGYVEFVWTAPPKPWMAVGDEYKLPDGKLFDRYTNWTCHTFDVPIYIESLDAAWFIVNASFTLNYDESLIKEIDITFDPAWDIAHTYDNTTDGVIDFYVETSGQLSGDVLVATITFHIEYQGSFPEISESPLEFTDITLSNHEIPIPTESPKNGKVTIEGLLTLPLPYLAVEPSDIVYGPAPAIGEEFQVNIVIKNLHFAWYLVGVDFRLTYCPDFLEVVSIEEGPYFPQFNQTPTPPYTVFVAYDEGTYITAMDLILPNGTGHYPAPLPGAEPPEDGTIAIVTFRIIDQDVSCDPETFNCDLELYDIMMVDKNGGYVPFDTPQNGTVTVYGSYETGRVIDVYTQYPAPYGGQGPNKPSDMFWPQKEVILYANVTYNCWPVQQKLVTFTVYDNQDNVWTQLQAVTDQNGVATTSFRMPWPCEDPESLLGVWKVKADVDIACEVVVDWVEFHYDYLINIVKVTTDSYYYEHCDYVTVTVEFTSHAQQEYTTSMWVTIHDELNVPIATTTLSFTIGGAEYCTPKQYSETFILHIDKFAAAGNAIVYVTPRLYWNGLWVAAGPMASTDIYILPS